ncbi:MAG: hypothetical protein K8T20_14725 [Planctomycetes bacterium]|nr:hypothetical protein [Planctomycetota bacterium]
MGTSQSSAGPGPGVPLVPPWADPLDPGLPFPPVPPEEEDGDPPKVVDAPAAKNPLAPSGRFSGARLRLGRFAQSRARKDLERGLGQYVKKGYGGYATAARRLSRTATTAFALNSALASLAAGAPSYQGSPADPRVLKGKSAGEVMDALVQAVRPTDGTLDAEASRAAVHDALSALLVEVPEADLLSLTAEQRVLVIERFVALDVYRRVLLDLWSSVQEKSATIVDAMQVMNQIRDYIKETIAVAFRDLKAAGTEATDKGVAKLVRDAIARTLEVFEEFAE